MTPVPLHHVVHSMQRRFGEVFIEAISGVPRGVIRRAATGSTPGNPEHIEALLKAKKRCYGFHPHNILVEAYEDQGTINDTSRLINVPRTTVKTALACGRVTHDVWIQMQLLALWEVWKTEDRAARYARKLISMKAYRERNK